MHNAKSFVSDIFTLVISNLFAKTKDAMRIFPTNRNYLIMFTLLHELPLAYQNCIKNVLSTVKCKWMVGNLLVQKLFSLVYATCS